MRQSPRIKRQHFVPQFYLRAFTSTPDERNPQAMRVWTFDKPSMRTWEARIQEVASRNGFHDLTPGDTKQELEKLFSNEIEPQFKDTVARLLACIAEGRPFDQTLKAEMGYFLAVQFLRTQAFRATIKDVLDQFGEIMRRQMKHVRPDLDWDAVRVEGRVGAARHAEFMFADATLRDLVGVFADHVWSVGRNITDTPFFTSDTPVVWHNYADLPPLLGRGGLGTYGAEVMFPLSPRHVLVMTERRYAQGRGQSVDGQVLPFAAGPVRLANALQVEQSDRQLFASANAFQLAHELREVIPGAFQPNRRRMTVG